MDVGAKGAVEDCFCLLSFVILRKINFCSVTLDFGESLQNSECTELCNAEIKIS